MTCLVLSLAVLIGLHDLAGVNYLVAYVTAFALGSAAGYLLNARFTFFAGSIHHIAAVRYLLVNAVLLCVFTIALKLLGARPSNGFDTLASRVCGVKRHGEDLS